MDKWEQLKHLLDAGLSHDVHYSSERPVEHNMLHKVKKWMIELEEKEKAEKGFLFTGVPTFDQKAWEEIQERKGLQGLS